MTDLWLKEMTTFWWNHQTVWSRLMVQREYQVKRTGTRALFAVPWVWCNLMSLDFTGSRIRLRGIFVVLDGHHVRSSAHSALYFCHLSVGRLATLQVWLQVGPIIVHAVWEEGQQPVDQGSRRNVKEHVGIVKLGERIQKKKKKNYDSDTLDFSSGSRGAPQSPFFDYVALQGPLVVPGVHIRAWCWNFSSHDKIVSNSNDPGIKPAAWQHLHTTMLFKKFFIGLTLLEPLV